VTHGQNDTVTKPGESIGHPLIGQHVTSMFGPPKTAVRVTGEVVGAYLTPVMHGHPWTMLVVQCDDGQRRGLLADLVVPLAELDPALALDAIAPRHDSGVPVGSVLVGVSFAPTTEYGTGQAFDTIAGAAVASLQAWAEVSGDFKINPPSIDEQWEMVAPGSGVTFRFVHERLPVSPAAIYTANPATQAERAAVAATAITSIRKIASRV
jgi:hypothetical protein